jgi:hypothetical protein
MPKLNNNKKRGNKMASIGIDDRDVQLRAIIKSNLVCGDINKLEEMVEEIFQDISDLLEIFYPSDLKEEH